MEGLGWVKRSAKLHSVAGFVLLFPKGSKDPKNRDLGPKYH